MDPLSIIASIAGVSQAGASLSKAIYRLISSTRGAPKEIADIARGVSELSVILSEVRRILRDGAQLFRRKLLRNIRSAMRRIDAIHGEIGKLMDIEGSIGRLKWAFRRSATLELLRQVETHKTGINTILQTMTLAVQISLASHPRETRSDSDDEADRALRRQQAENVVEASYQSLKELVETDAMGSQPDQSPSDATVPPDGGDGSESQLDLWRDSRDETAEWLYRIVFSAYAESRAEAHADPDIEVEDDTEGKRRAGDLSLTVTQKPINPRRVVDELLAEWTDLSDDEIRGLVKKSSKAKGPGDQEGSTRKEFQQQEKSQQRQKPSDQERSRQHDIPRELPQEKSRKPEKKEPLDQEIEIIKFKDAVGRKFSFPYHIIKPWTGMEEVVKQAFLHVDVIGPHVMEGHYDLIGPDGGIILPLIWESLIKPEMTIEMRMWPMEKAPQRPAQPPPPLQPRISHPRGPFRFHQAGNGDQGTPQATPQVPSQTLPEIRPQVPARGPVPRPGWAAPRNPLVPPPALTSHNLSALSGAASKPNSGRQDDPDPDPEEPRNVSGSHASKKDRRARVPPRDTSPSPTTKPSRERTRIRELVREKSPSPSSLSSVVSASGSSRRGNLKGVGPERFGPQPPKKKKKRVVEE